MAVTSTAGTGDPTATPIVVVDPSQLAPSPALVSASPVAPPPAPQPQIVAPDPHIDEEDRADGVTATGDRAEVPREKFKRIKDRAADRGRREAEAALNTRATAIGFATVDEMFAALERSQQMATPNAPGTTTPATTAAAAAAAAALPPPQANPPPVAPPPVPAIPPGAQPNQARPGEEIENDRRVPENIRKKLRVAREEMRTAQTQADARAKAAEAKYTEAQHQMDVWKEQQRMREDMIRAGVKDVDYLHYELQKYLQSIAADEEKLKGFDHKAWMDEMRKSRPYLFGENPVPANTGVTQPPPAPPPGPGNVTNANAAAGQKDARKMSPLEFREYQKAHGLPVR